MADKPGKGGTDAVEAQLVGVSYELAALFSILERKGLISTAEFMDERERLRREVKPPVDPDPYVIKS